MEKQANFVPVRRALISVSDKQGLADLAQVLIERGVKILASGGTRSQLVDAGYDAIEVSSHTGQPEILGGRVKTLHPKIHGGILARRELAEDRAALEKQGFEPIDLVVVNLYPFEQTAARVDATLEDAIEQIDIGGPALIRSAAKNHAHVVVLTSPDQYNEFIRDLRDTGGTTLSLRRRFALAAFRSTARYDAAIHAYLTRVFESAEVSLASDSANSAEFPAILEARFERRAILRYGENPHQRAAFYADPKTNPPNLTTASIRHGKELSYNNLLDLDSALRLIRLFREPAAAILKHNNPCGAAEAVELAEAFEQAYEGDPVSAFGGIVALNRPVDRETASRLIVPGRFIEAIVAPGFDDDAFRLLTTKPTWKNSVRLLDLRAAIGPDQNRPAGFDLRRVEGGMLVQDWDRIEDDPTAWTIASKRSPTLEEIESLRFAWKVCAAVKSNAIVLAQARRLVGVGAGQMSRLDSVKIALEKARERSRGAVLASDAFFPFRDGPDLASDAGISAIIQPGGSRRDDETILACDERAIALVLTGRRHFRH